MRRRRKSALIPSILAIILGIVAIAAFLVAGNLDAAYTRKLADWVELRQWYGDPKPTKPPIVPLYVTSGISGLACLSLLAVAILRAGRATRA
jgi:hypothetical protein